MSTFKTRRDSSQNNVPVVGYQNSADAQDTILWAAVKVTDTGSTDSNGNFQAQNTPIIDTTHDWTVDSSGVGRGRIIDGNDITAQDSGSNTLYVGKADGKSGNIPLYTDSGLTTSAASLTGVQVTYTTLVPVQTTADGKLKVEIASGSLPAGSNNIGSVNIANSIPAGNNNIGEIEIFNPRDNGGEKSSIRIRDSLAGVTLAAMGYDDGHAIPQYPLSVAALPTQYYGPDGMHRVRGPQKYKTATATATGAANFWTPSSSASVGLLGWTITAGEDCTFNWRVAGSDIDPAFPLTKGVPQTVNLPNIWTPGSSGDVLGYDITNASSSSPTVGIMAWGTEE